MSERKWTPGTWVADVSDKSDVVVWTSGDSEFVCNIGHAVQRVDVAFDIDIHNAHLIASAPDLYEALDNLLRVSEGEGGTKYHAGDIARAALAKARGE